MTMLHVYLGSEADDALFDQLCEAVRSLGGSISDSEWVLGGSQEMTTYKIILPNGSLKAVAETYVGLSIQGPAVLVSALAQRIMQAA